jgi:hypothetical protein
MERERDEGWREREGEERNWWGERRRGKEERRRKRRSGRRRNEGRRKNERKGGRRKEEGEEKNSVYSLVQSVAQTGKPPSSTNQPPALAAPASEALCRGVSAEVECN